jgi:hypothetical protein
LRDDSCGEWRDCFRLAHIVANRPDPNSRYKAEALAAARLLIARRIARFCTSLSPAEFDCLLDKMVGVHWKYDILPHLDPLAPHRDESDTFRET